MKIFAIGSGVPYRTHGEAGVTAVNIVLWQLLSGLAKLDHEIVLQLLFNEYRTGMGLTAPEEEELRHLEGLGVRTLPPIYPGEYLPAAKPASRISRLMRMVQWGVGGNGLQDFYPAVVLRDAMRERIRAHQVDAVLTIWSPEGVAATHGIRAVPRIVYHGDVDFGPAVARMQDRALFDEGPKQRVPGRALWNSIRERLWVASFRRAHLRLMEDVDVVANVTACNAEFYAAQGHDSSVYVGNVWYDPDAERPSAKDPAPSHGVSSRPIKIIGHVGKLRQTGSTYGLRFLLVDLLPELDRVMDGLDYEVHIIGAGNVVPALRRMLEHPRVLLRGFVEDLDSELRSSDVFLLLNNAGSYQAAYTRHVVAWAQELCLIVHENSCRAIPEIRHMENALIGSTPADIARMVRLAASDPELNLRLRKGGRGTYERHFTPAVVAKALADEIGRAVADRFERPRS